MVLARSGFVAATLLILQSTLSIAAPVLDKAIPDLEKRIACHTNEVAINNACVSCASLYTNATTCSRSEPLTCSYGVPNSKRKCAAVDCSKTPGTYLSPDAKQCLPCTDPNAATCNSTTTLTCLIGYTLYNNTCYAGNPYSIYRGYGLAKPFSANQQPFKLYTPANGDGTLCYVDHYQAQVVYYPGTGSTCTGQNGPLDQNLVKTSRQTNSDVLLKGYCVNFGKNPFVTANGAQAVCEQYFIAANGDYTYLGHL